MTQTAEIEDSPVAQTLPAEPVSGSQTPGADLPNLADLTDEQISTLTQEITDSYTKDIPLVGPLLPISVLLEEFKGNEPFLRKLGGLAEKWEGFRRTSPNGNCFYEAFAYAWLDSLQREGHKRIGDEIIKVQNTAGILEEAGFDKLAYEDFLDTTLAVLVSLSTSKPSSLAETLNNIETSSAIVVYLRFLSSTHLRLNPDLYAPFLEPPYYDNVALFCQQCIEAFGRDADHVAILALARAIQVGVDVSYLDRSDTGEEPIVYEFRPDEWHEGGEKVELLYRPGHYDILCYGES